MTYATVGRYGSMRGSYPLLQWQGEIRNCALRYTVAYSILDSICVKDTRLVIVGKFKSVCFL